MPQKKLKTTESAENFEKPVAIAGGVTAAMAPVAPGVPGAQASPAQPGGRKVSPTEAVRRRIQDWKDEDPSTLLTKHIEKVASPLHQLVSLMLPDALLKEVLTRTLWAAEALTERNDVLKTLGFDTLEEVRSRAKIDQCDGLAEQTQYWAVGAAAALGAWDLVGPLGLVPALTSLLTLSFRTIKKIGLAYGYDTSSHQEERIVLEIFLAATTLYHRDKVVALKAIEKLERGHEPVSRESVEEMIDTVAAVVASNLTRRRTFASIPALGALVGVSTNAWLVQDICKAARNVYAARWLEAKKDQRKATAAAKAKAAEAAEAAKSAELPKAA